MGGRSNTATDEPFVDEVTDSWNAIYVVMPGTSVRLGAKGCTLQLGSAYGALQISAFTCSNSDDRGKNFVRSKDVLLNC